MAVARVHPPTPWQGPQGGSAHSPESRNRARGAPSRRHRRYAPAAPVVPYCFLFFFLVVRLRPGSRHGEGRRFPRGRRRSLPWGCSSGAVAALDWPEGRV